MILTSFSKESGLMTNMDQASKDALDIAKIAAMVSGNMKQIDSATSTPVTQDKMSSNRINPEVVYHQQKQKLQQSAGGGQPPPAAAAPLPVAAAAPPPVAPPPVAHMPPPVVSSVANTDIQVLLASIDKLVDNTQTLLTSINKLQKMVNKSLKQIEQ